MKYIPAMLQWLRRVFSRKRPSVEEILLPDSKLEAFAAKFIADTPASDPFDTRVTEAFRRARLWIAEVRAGEVKA